MVTYKTFWVQWDYQIGTYRGSANNKIFGVTTGQFMTPGDICAAMGVVITAAETDELLTDQKMANLAVQITKDIQTSDVQVKAQVTQVQDAAQAQLDAKIAQDIADAGVVIK